MPKKLDAQIQTENSSLAEFSWRRSLFGRRVFDLRGNLHIQLVLVEIWVLSWLQFEFHSSKVVFLAFPGTDRNNIVEVLDPVDNYPVPFENSTMFSGAKLIWSSSRETKTLQDVAVSLASVGYYTCLTGCRSSPKAKKTTLNNLLNNADASYRGLVLQLSRGEYHYICSRNNNFSNRSQKGMITVMKKPWNLVKFLC